LPEKIREAGKRIPEGKDPVTYPRIQGLAKGEEKIPHLPLPRLFPCAGQVKGPEKDPARAVSRGRNRPSLSGQPVKIRKVHSRLAGKSKGTPEAGVYF